MLLQVESLKQLIESVRSELHDAISGMSQKVKFELLHDEVPQVNTLKAYIQQTEQAMARTLERLGEPFALFGSWMILLTL